MKYIKLSSLLIATCLSVILFAPPVLAKSDNARSGKPEATLTEGRTRACEARASNVQKQLATLISMASNMLDVFANHATRVEDYYKNVILPTGKTVSNYDALVATIATKKQAVTDAWNKTKTDASGFSCTTGDPKQLLLQFRTDMQATKQALHAYRTAIKNLIVAVARIAPNPTPTPRPSASPSTQ